MNLFIEFITGGYLAQLILLLLIPGTIAYLTITRQPVPDALFDMGFMIVGYYFHAATSASIRRFTLHNIPGNEE